MGGEIMSDVLIIGTGIAGLVAALECADNGLHVDLITKEDSLLESNSRYAQGGVVYLGENDSPDLLAKDIALATGGIANPEAIRIVAGEGRGYVQKLLIEKYGVPFSRKKNGELDLSEEAAHSRRRIAHIEDATGLGVMETLKKRVLKSKNIAVYKKHAAVDIILEEYHTRDPFSIYLNEPRALGAYVYDEETNKVKIMNARAVVLATGGMGQAYLHTTNSRCATGDGYAMAYRANVRLINMEYTQFHPTTMYLEEAHNALITEAIRGEGAELLTRDGKPFMHTYDKRGSLAPRDIVSQSIVTELIARGDEYVLLDCARIPKKTLQSHFPNVLKRCKAFGIDASSKPIPVVPAFHFMCGGVRVDMRGRTSVSNLYAIGETACTGLHGANRLASTSLLEGLTFGAIAAADIAKRITTLPPYKASKIRPWVDKDLEEKIDPALMHEDWVILKTTMWNYVGVMRTGRGLNRAIHALKSLRDDVDRYYRDTKLKRQLIEIRNAIQSALVVAQSAFRNPKSAGTHHRL